MMSQDSTDWDLRQAVRSCSGGFSRVLAELHQEQPEATQLDSLQEAWTIYYFGEFAHFDALLRTHVESGGRMSAYLPLSISHHNLHRLMEVLHLEIGERSLDATRIPERIVDLLEACNRLTTLLKELPELGVSEANTMSVSV